MRLPAVGVILTLLLGSASARYLPPWLLSKSTTSTLASEDTRQKLYQAHQYAAAAYCIGNSRTAKNVPPNPYVSCETKACMALGDKSIPIIKRFSRLGNADATGFVAIDAARAKIIVSFRGSTSIKNDLADTRFEMVPAVVICLSCTVVEGFYEFWLSAKSTVEQEIISQMKANPHYQIEVVGHSLGAAVATIAAGYLRNQGYLVDLYSFSSPRAGNEAFAEHVSSRGAGANYRVTHLADWVPKVPPYPYAHHVADEYYITAPSHTEVRAKDISIFKGYQFKEYLGGNGVTKKTDTSFDSHSWIFDNITECSPGLSLNDFLNRRGEKPKDDIPKVGDYQNEMIEGTYHPSGGNKQPPTYPAEYKDMTGEGEFHWRNWLFKQNTRPEEGVIELPALESARDSGITFNTPFNVKPPIGVWPPKNLETPKYGW